MTETLPRLEEPPIGPERQARAVAQAGAVRFADLVWAHFLWVEARETGAASEELEGAYLRKLREFEAAEGPIAKVYWSTVAASAVAMTECPRPKRGRDPLRLREPEADIRLHRVTDWLLDESELPHLVQQCDVLASRVRQNLRGGSQRVAMERLYGVLEQVLGLIERTEGRPRENQERKLVKAQLDELRAIEESFLTAGNQGARVVYFSGMLIGTVVMAALGLLAALPLWLLGLLDGGDATARELALLFLCFGSGMVGALVSVMSRLRPGGNFRIDFEIGRPLVRRLGLFRPAVGAVFGVLLYAVLKSGLLLVEPEGARFPGDPVYYFAVTGFLAGFSERWVHVIIGGAKRTIAPGKKNDEEDGD